MVCSSFATKWEPRITYRANIVYNGNLYTFNDKNDYATKISTGLSVSSDEWISELGRTQKALDKVNKTISKNQEEKKMIPMIKDVNVIVDGKVVVVTFQDGKTEKMICHEDDKFSLREALFIAIAKKLYRKDYTFEGIQVKAEELKLQKKYVKEVDKALKNYHTKCCVEAEKIKQADEEAERRNKMIQKKIRRREKARGDKINMMKEAYVRALKEVGACE